jgi:4-hydroxy-tetrahydrodipicolinate synthase
LSQVSEVIRLCPDDFAVLSGDDFTSMPTVLVGGTGVISVTSNVAPKDMAQMMDAALAGDLGMAKQMHYKLFPLMKAMFYDTNPVPAKKTLELMGKIKSGTPRLPLAPINDEILPRLKAAIADYGLI